jgi:adenosine deaminase
VRLKSATIYGCRQNVCKYCCVAHDGETDDHHLPVAHFLLHLSLYCTRYQSSLSSTMSREESALLASMILFSATALMATNYTRQKQTKHEKDLRNNTNNAKKLVRYLSDRPAWQSYNDDDELFIREFPKIELHVHLDGSFDPDFLWRYTQDNPDLLACLPVSTDLPWDRGQTLAVRDMVQKCQTQREFHQLCSCRGRRSLKAMLNCFEIFLPLVRRNLDLLEQLAFDFCKRQWEQNTIYTEVRYSPHLLAESYHKDIDKGDAKMVDAEAVYQAITRGLRHGCNKFPGIVVNQILCAITWRPDWAMPTVAMVHAHRNDFPCAAVGVDIAAGETHFDKENYPDLYEPHMDMIKEAVAKKIPITIHAGESTEHATDNVRRAVLEYQANRIGHGYGMVKNESIMQLVKEKNVHVEGRS